MRKRSSRWVNLWFLPMVAAFHLAVAVASPAAAVHSNSITSNGSLRDGMDGRDTQSLLSPGGTFRLGFFTAAAAGGPNSARYLGIWYANIPTRTVVWVANRDNPLRDLTGSLGFRSDGSLLLLDRSATVYWRAPGASGARDPVLELLDTGNLVLRNASGGGGGSEGILWQSFDDPFDTLLPGMKVGGGRSLSLTSQRGPGDLSAGDYSYKMDTRGSPQLFLWNRMTRIYRTGRWDGISSSSSSAAAAPAAFFQFSGGSSGGEAEYTFDPTSRAALPRLVLNQSGFLELLVWEGGAGRWNSHWWSPKDKCDRYGRCGDYGVCGVSGETCRCLEGFQPFPAPDYGDDSYKHCQRTAALSCREGERFVKVEGLRLPDTSLCSVEKGLEVEQYREKCSKDCSCVAFAAAEVGGGCVNWYGSLIDLREDGEGGRELYVRLGASDQETTTGFFQKKKHVIVITVVTTVSGLLFLWLAGFFVWKRNMNKQGRKKKKRDLFLFGKVNNLLFTTTKHHRYYDDDEERTGSGKGARLRSYDLSTILMATEHFAAANMLGQGGFGQVYKIRPGACF